jgi:signal transduction histidine kinase
MSWKTPLTVIRGSAEALKDGIVTDTDKIKVYYSQIISESKYLQSLVGDLLDLSKLQNSDFPIEKEPIDLSDVLEDAVRSVRGLADAKDIQLKTEFLQKASTSLGIMRVCGRCLLSCLITPSNFPRLERQSRFTAAIASSGSGIMGQASRKPKFPASLTGFTSQETK